MVIIPSVCILVPGPERLLRDTHLLLQRHVEELSGEPEDVVVREAQWAVHQVGEADRLEDVMELPGDVGQARRSSRRFLAVVSGQRRKVDDREGCEVGRHS